MNLRKMTPIAAALALTWGATNTAQADVLASAVLQVTNAQLVNVDTGSALTNGIEILIAGGGNSANVSADLGSVPGSDEYSQPASSPAPIDLPQAQQGGAPVGPNDFSPFTNPDDPSAGDLVVGGNFAMADQLLTGAIVNLPDFGIIAGADAKIRADSFLSSNDTGDSIANVGTDTSIEILATSDLTIRLDATYEGDGEAWASAGTAPVSSALFQYTFTFDIVDQDTGNSMLGGVWSPFSAQTGSRNDGATGKTDRNIAPTFFSSPTATLLAGQLYTVTLSNSVLADTTNTVAVPAPGVLALLSAGLFGIGTMSSRKRRGKLSTRG